MTSNCFDFYSFDKEDKTPLSLPGWKPFNGDAQWVNASELCPRPWRYASLEALNFLPTWGYFGIYDGGGFVADLGYNQKSASHVISDLKRRNWVDRQTRAVLIEFTIYNVNTGYLSVCTYFFEMLPTGYGNVYKRIDTLLLTSTQTGFYQFYLVCQLLFIVMVLYFIVREAAEIFRKKCRYFVEIWNLIELSQIVSSLLVVVVYLVKSKFILSNVLKLKENPFVTVSFQEAVSWNDAESAILSITVFITTVKLLRMFRFNVHISILSSSISISKATLMSYSVLLFIIFLAFAQLGNLTFGANLYGYSNIQRTLYSGLLMSIGGNMELDELRRVNRILGPLFGFSFMYLMAFIFINFFVAILNDSYEDVKNNTDKTGKEFEMADFISERLSEILLGFRRRKKSEHEESTGPEVRNYSAFNSSRERLIDVDSESHEGNSERLFLHTSREVSAEDTAVKEHDKSDKRYSKKSTERDISSCDKEWSPEDLVILKTLAKNPYRLRRLKRKHKNLASLMAQADATRERVKKEQFSKNAMRRDARPARRKNDARVQRRAGKVSSTITSIRIQGSCNSLENLLNNLVKDSIMEDIELACFLLNMNRSSKENMNDFLTPDDRSSTKDDSSTEYFENNCDDGDPLLLFKFRSAQHQQLPAHLKKRGIAERLRTAMAKPKRKRRVTWSDQPPKLFSFYSYLK